MIWVLVVFEFVSYVIFSVKNLLFVLLVDFILVFFEDSYCYYVSEGEIVNDVNI